VASDQGLRFQVDSMMVGVLAEGRLPEAIRQLHEQKHLIWKKHLAESRKMSQEQAMAELEQVQKHLEKVKEMQAMGMMRAGEPIEISISLAPEVIEKVRVLKELQSKGVWIPAVPDSIQKIVITSTVAGAPLPSDADEG